MLLLVDCAGHYRNDLTASVYLIVLIVSKSHAEFSPPIGALIELRSNVNLPCLVNLALDVLVYMIWGKSMPIAQDDLHAEV